MLGCHLILFVTCIKVGDWLVSKDLKMKPKLGALQAMFPDISMPVLQEQLAAAEGHLPNAVKVFLFKAPFRWSTPPSFVVFANNPCAAHVALATWQACGMICH